MQVASWVKINMRALRQRYAQELEAKCSHGTILFTKGDLIQLIQNVADFDPQGCLWDSPHNLRRMAQMQDDMLAHRNALNTFPACMEDWCHQSTRLPGDLGRQGSRKSSMHRCHCCQLWSPWMKKRWMP